VSILDEIKKPSALSKCNKVGHRGFKKGCPTCAFEEILRSGKTSQTNNNNTKSAAYVSSSSAPGPWGSGISTPPSPPPNPSGNSSLKFFGVAALFLIFGLFFYNNSQDNSYVTNNSSNISPTSNTTNYCNHNPSQCNNTELCKKATLANKWDNRNGFKQFANVAKQRGLKCGVREVLINCNSEPTKCNNTELCKKATLANKWEIRDHFKGYANLAKQKGLTCGVSQYSNNQTYDANSICETDPIKCSDKQLCFKATRNNKWETGDLYKKYVNLAKERSLSCGVSQYSIKPSKIINISGSWKIYKCSTETYKVIGNNRYFVQLRRNKITTELIFGIENKPFKFGKSADLQVDTYKKLPDAPIDYQYWSGANKFDKFAVIDLTYNKSFIKQLKGGYDLVIKNDFGQINVDLRGFSNAYNQLYSRKKCD